ncbi:MAG: helix-turn-helix transcriptional regulator [Oscillospiraceae bacterium]|nr:helix-turn-helix transcriptional regulator [Oscillospiraceae bacterium]
MGMDFQRDRRFGQRIRELRKARGWTQEQAVAKLQLIGYDISRGGLAKIESGTRHVYLDDVIALKEVFQISFDELMQF